MSFACPNCHQRCGDEERCEECGHCSVCCVCGPGDGQTELFDADELGLDPEDDDARRYGTQP